MRPGFILLFTFCSAVVIAQNNTINPTTQLWSEVDLAGRISQRFKWQLDLQYSRQSPYESYSFLKDNEQLTIRPWLHFYPNKRFRISTFIGIWYNYAITEVGAREYPEYRSALQVNYYSGKDLNLVVNRFRTEFRYIKDRQGNFEFVLRERYMLKYQRLLLHTSYDKNSIYFIAQNEFFVNNGSKVTGYHFFDQNRVFIGFGYNFTDDIGIETGYFNQFQQHNHDDNFDINHIWQLSLLIDNVTKLHKH